MRAAIHRLFELTADDLYIFYTQKSKYSTLNLRFTVLQWVQSGADNATQNRQLILARPGTVDDDDE